MRIVFMGTPEFAVESLKILIESGCNVVGVITSPDKPAGRGQKIHQSPVKEYALAQNLNILQPEKLKDPAFIDQLRGLNADLQIVVAFRMLPEAVWNMPPHGTFNLHASLLPQYRGAAPINWAIINGEKQTGVTTFFIRHEIDTGGIIHSQPIEIEPADNAGSVHDKLMYTGARLVLQTVRDIESQNIIIKPQEELASGQTLKPAPKIFKEDCKIDWRKDAEIIHNLVRGLSPYPTAWTELIAPDGLLHNFKIFDTEIIQNKLGPSEISTNGKNFLHIGCGYGTIAVKSLQMAGKKRMLIEEFLRGFKPEGWKINF